MAFNLTTQGRTLTVSLMGSVDLSESAAIKEASESQMNSDITQLWVDGGALTYIDSSGVAALLYLRKLATRYNAAFAISSMSEAGRRVIELAKLQGILGLGASASVVSPQAAQASVAPPAFIPPAAPRASVAMDFKESEALAAIQQPKAAAPQSSPAPKSADPLPIPEHTPSPANDSVGLGVKPGSFS